MAPFTAQSLLTGLKDRIESILLQGDTLFLGTSTGALNSYAVETKGEEYTARFVESRPNFTRRSIDQLGYIRDVNSLVTLSDGVVTLSPIPALSPATPLTQARNAMSFAIHVSIQMINSEGEAASVVSGATGSQQGVPTVITQLAVGCQKKLVLYSWKDGEAQDVREIKLPHSPRGLAFCSAQMLVMAYTATDHAIAYLTTNSVAELSLPVSIGTAAAASGVTGLGMGKVSMNAFSGLGGYVGLGGKAQKPSVIQLSEGEVLVTKEAMSFFIGDEGKLSRKNGMTWSSPSEETAFVKPYVLAVLPASPALNAPPRIHIRSSLSLANTQTLSYPFPSSDEDPKESQPSTLTTSASGTVSASALLRLLTPSPSSKSPAFLLTTPTDKAALTANGSTLWAVKMQSWGAQVDELVEVGEYEEALGLLESIDGPALPDKVRRTAHVRALRAVQLFSQGSYDEAVNAFLELDINPAKVVALYPESVSGRLAKPREDWLTLFGAKGTNGIAGLPKSRSSSELKAAGLNEPHEGGSIPLSSSAGEIKPDVQVSAEKPSAGDVTVQAEASGPKDPPKPSSQTTDKKSVETLLRYLSDRRPKLSGALQTHGITPSQAHLHPSLSSSSVDELFSSSSLPDGVPISSLVPDQLLRFAQIVDTALFKSYLLIRPSLVGSLCRIENWCDVGEVEEELRHREKFTDLIDLYRGKKMHEKALTLIHDLSKEEDDIRDKLEPAIRYLQKLGPDYLDLVFKHARWVLDTDRKMGLQIFTAEDAKLPRERVSEYLLDISPALCAGYMEYLIDEAGEANVVFHDRLAELYLHAATAPAHTEAERAEAYTKLLHFIRTSEDYSPDRLIGRLPPNSLFEARAIVLGRLNKHEAALDIYVHRLHDYDEAEAYCKRVYETKPDPSPTGIFHKLLKIYLADPSATSSPGGHSLLEPALDLIAHHTAELDSPTVLSMLPPLVPASAIRTFLFDALDPSRMRGKAGKAASGGKVISGAMKEIWKARKQEVEFGLVALETRRVSVGNSRICPNCHKRIGSSVIAVHFPRGEVTHYQCREAFAAQKQGNQVARR